MFLRSLAIRGFKSFADATSLEVEPGITVIVGPNGSGKSNVVDALSWVLGTHSAKKVRGGSMADVIFAGSPHRTRASRARVEIVIDNADGRLSVDGLGSAASAGQFSEVRIARTIHDGGESLYQINGQEVRALDVQELLSDTGLGRELHTIVGQGQLDEILNAKPEERRRYIEEAAGILKHRRRRERATRKLEQVDGHIDKLRTVLRELRRQLKPLERQAEAADRYRALQADLRAVRVELAAAELARLRTLEASGDQDGARSRAALEELTVRLDAERAAADELDRAVVTDTEAAEAAQSTYYRLTSLAERLRGTAELIEARRRHLVEYVEEPLAGRPPAALRTQAGQVSAAADARREARERAREDLELATTARREAEQARREHEQERQLERRRRAEARERLLRWEGEVSALRGAIAAAEAESARVGASLEGLDDRLSTAQREVDRVQSEIQELDAAEVALTASLEAAEAEVAERRAVLDEAVARARELASAEASQQARAEALRAALEDRDAGPRALLGAGLEGVLGAVVDHLRVGADTDRAVAAALGPLGEAVVVTGVDEARRSVEWLRGAAASALVLAARGPDAVRVAPETAARLVAGGARPIAEVVAPRDASADSATVVAGLRRVLRHTYLAPDWSSAVALHAQEPALTFVTPDGDLAGPFGYAAAGSPERSAVLTANAAVDAEERARALAGELARVEGHRAEAAASLAEAEASLATATERINESDARITGAAEQLARLNKEVHALTNQREVVAAQHAELRQVRDRDRVALSELNSRGPASEEPDAGDVDPEAQEVALALDEAVEGARDRELEHRVAFERSGEQVRALEEQADGLRREADDVEAALEEAARRREARRRGIARCADLAVVARLAIAGIETSVTRAGELRDARRADLAGTQERLTHARAAVAGLGAELDELREHRHAADLRAQEVASRLSHLTDRVRSELSLSLEELALEHPDAEAFDVGALTEREDELVRKVGLLGRVNPLALEEFRALEERHAFLADQLDDLRRSKADLASVVTAVDERIREVFRVAFEDVAREFELTFATVFPGGHGRLVLTDPEDLLTTGIDVEARPPGKKVTRLSLLSGGERSLTVLALVFAIFRARPSPFYVLDEVDAALDDVNLQRLLKLVRSFRGHAQVIMVTHQKRSMEIADVLYGVTMGPDAVTTVVAERLREPDAARRAAALSGRASAAPTEALVQDVDAPA